MVAVDSTGRVWAATGAGLARFDGERFVLDSPDVIGPANISFIAVVRGGLLVGSTGRLFLRGPDDDITPIAAGSIPEGTAFVDGTMDRDGTWWIATRSGALRIRGDRVDRIGPANGLLTELLNGVTIDREGDVWFGTESGASKHVPGPFRTYTAREGIPSDFVRALEVDQQGRLWLGTRDGVAVREGDRFREVSIGDVPDRRVFSLAHEPSGGFLVGTRRGLVWLKNGRPRLYLGKDGLPGEMVYSLVHDRAGGVWIGTDHGLARWENGVITKIARPELERLSIISMALDHRNRLWMGRTQGGIAILDGDRVTLLGPAEGVTDQTVWALAADAAGTMWAATNGEGALRFDDAGVRRYTMQDGLASNFVWQVLADSRGDIWLFGNLGLNRLSGDRMVHYGRGSGLIELEGSATAAHEDTDGTLWFGTGSGVVRYEPGLDVPPAVAPPIYIEQVTHDGEPVALTAAAHRLARGELHIRFASPSFRDESVIRFRYRLVGARDGWSAPGSARSITYAGLGPGRYQFEVVAINGSLQSAAPARIVFTVLPAFWQTIWFRVLGALALVAATVTVPVLRTRVLERERARLEALVAQHTRELAEKNARLEQSNRDLEHFAYVASHDLQEPLRKIQAFSDRVGRQYAEKIDAQGRDYLTRMGSAASRMQRLIDDLLSLSRVTTRGNPLEPIDLSPLVDEVVNDLEHRIQTTRGTVEVGDLPVIHADPVQMRQVFQNLIGNALKFHRPDVPPVVRVTAVRTGTASVEISIEDNGIGFENKDAERVFLPFQRLHGRTQYEGTGIGLTIVQKIIERHGGRIRAQSEPGRGTRFAVTLPLYGTMGEKHAA
jgi:signal transduction histidine kinase/ligand-binding sensor domain-containing protein